MRHIRAICLFCILAVILPMHARPIYAANPGCGNIAVPGSATPSAGGKAIANGNELQSALSKATGGEIFLLAPGKYGGLFLKKRYASAVTISSADPKAPACFDELRIKGALNIRLDGLVFDYTYSPGDRNTTNPFTIENSDKVTILNSVFDGDRVEGAGHGRGLNARDSNDIEVVNTVFRTWWKAFTGDSVNNVLVRGNNIYDIRSDGFGFGVANGLRIEANRFHNFKGASGKDHRDMIQIMRSSNKRSTNIVIRDNIFDMGAGDYSQTIWMGGDGKNLGDPMLRHQNILIENNMIYNAHTHGISIHGVDNLEIRRNTLIRIHRDETGGVTIPKINVATGSTYVVIEQNVVGGIIGHENQRDWVVKNNAIIQDNKPGRPGYYDDQFIYYARGPVDGYNEYGVKPNSLVDQLGAGSTIARTYPSRR